ncbi:MAG: rane protein of unknown function [Candidatus Saccharibacteria bacterium]|nr:rane protein of unknown function [Candidatus Saccharibacteria bacterium]
MALTQTAKKPRHRTYARNRAGTKKVQKRLAEADGVYFLKLVLVVLLSTLWLKLATPLNWHGIPLGGFPVGAMVTLITIKLFERDQYDRKIWFAVLTIVTILSYFVPAGIVI